MKKTLVTFFTFTAFVASAQNVGINTTGATPHPSAALDVSATNKGFLAPRVADTNAISAPATGLIIYDLSSNCYRFRNNVQWSACGFGGSSVPAGAITTLACGSATLNGGLTVGVSATGSSIVINYTGGNGGSYNSAAVTSTGVTGLTATRPAGIFASGNGSITYNLSGTPATAGNASFVITIGGQSCTVTVPVSGAAYPPGTVHCGNPTAVVDIVSPGTGRIWMDRNLGSPVQAASFLDTSAHGGYFQWGRAADGHQCSNSQVTTIKSGSTTPGNSFFIASTTGGDWMISGNSARWQGVNGINNPCPTGYRIPTLAEWNSEISSWGNTADDRPHGFSSLKLITDARYRDGRNGIISGNSNLEGGLYYSSTIWTGARIYSLAFSNDAYVNYENLTPNGTATMTFGYMVRCIKN